MEQAAFFEALVAWQRRRGRHHLPWQGTRDPYRVWLSEIMLQQTQVATVLPYYQRFLQRFPHLAALAQAAPDEVLAHWSGLGYYSRARNLHACAIQIEQQGGRWPGTAAELQRLPGIGASTAAAIAAFCFGERVSILDGNAQRLLARLLAFEGDLAHAPSKRLLWQQAQALLAPQASADHMAAYTQGLMDLGAQICTRSKPRCPECPVAALCQGLAQQRLAELPHKSRRSPRRHEDWWLLLLRRADGAIWLQQRPPRGIWAGLYAPPVLHSEQAAVQPPSGACAGQAPIRHPVINHSLTHRELRLHPVQWQWAANVREPQADWPADSADPQDPQDPALGPGRWLHALAHPKQQPIALPAPIRAWLLENL
ncbi:MAG: A/G-specific adenine glycosylase [Serpentinimonas sp.]|nr:A/G-specific adenine glycosylase [Serpentinimonas sp.]MDO9612557.1 A/G-specific adenine glycosylase [Serpentinimonas sp.]